MTYTINASGHVKDAETEAELAVRLAEVLTDPEYHCGHAVLHGTHDQVTLNASAPGLSLDPALRHPSTTQMLAHFAHGHLPPHLASVSAPFGRLARQMATMLDDGPELTVALRKLLESKDCAVRAAVEQYDVSTPEPVAAGG